MRREISLSAKQTFQVVALIATILVVGIHYKSDIPNSPNPADSTWNELAQEYIFGALARVAVPIFAFAAGFFYFLSDDGRWATYGKKIGQRCRTVAIPYFVTGSVAMLVWLLFRRLQSESVEFSLSQFLSQWFLHPPAEQLWFLRDLMVLVAIAPLIRIGNRSTKSRCFVNLILAGFWLLNIQCFPIVSGWSLLQMETLFFFSMGCAATHHIGLLERVFSVQSKTIVVVTLLWAALAGFRVWFRPDFDLWYVKDYGLMDLLLHQASILVGCCALLMISSRLQQPIWVRLSGSAFFVFLIHEFPLRAIVDRFVPYVMDARLSCWFVVPLVVAGCFSFADWCGRRFPVPVAFLTGGRTPQRAAKISGGGSSSQKLSPFSTQVPS